MREAVMLVVAMGLTGCAVGGKSDFNDTKTHAIVNGTVSGGPTRRSASSRHRTVSRSAPGR